MDRTALLESLIQAIYEAAASAAGWLSFLMSFASALDGTNPSLYLADTSGRDGSIEISVGMDEQYLRAYKDYYVHRNVWIEGARPLLRPGIVRSSHDMCSRREFLRSEWYGDFCKPLNWTQGLGATIFQDGSMTANIGVFADDKRRAYDEEDLSFVRALMPHLQRGMQIQRRLTEGQVRGHALERVLNGVSTPIFTVAGSGKVHFMNAAAERLVSQSAGLRIDSGELHALVPEETRSLRRFVAAAARTAAGQGRKPGGILRVSRPLARAPLELLVVPLVASQDEWLLQQPPVAAIFVNDPEALAAAADSFLIRSHGLTAMEAKVALALSRGLSGKDICRELHISYNTLKTHMRHVYAKTSTRRQSDLVRFLAAALQVAGPRDRGGPSSAT